MKLDKINDNSFKCLITKEELERRNLKLDDFVKNSDNVQDLIHEVMEMAHEEFGFIANSDSIALRMMPMNDGDLKLIFCGGTSEAQLSSFFAEFMKAAGSLAEGVSQDNADAAYGKQSPKKKVKSEVPELVILKFGDIDTVSDYCRRVYRSKPVCSELYKDAEGLYYLVIRRLRLSKKTFEEMINISGDYCEIVGAGYVRLAHIEETMEQLVRRRAVKILAEL